MTKQESFKRRIRTRMEKTGERYAAARRALIDRLPQRHRRWISGAEAVKKATGREWESWCDLIAAWPGHTQGHTAIAAHLHKELGIDAWWAQGVTVGYERITGLRLPYQRSDGTFAASKSRTVAVDAALLNSMLRDADDLEDLFPGHAAELRSRKSAKTIRIAIGNGVALLSVTPVADGRCKVAVEHAGLPTSEEVERWRFFWDEWLDALGDMPVPGRGKGLRRAQLSWASGVVIASRPTGAST